MITFLRGNIFESKAAALVNTVNCVGIMGKGIAHQFARAYPSMHDTYIRECKQQLVRLGSVRIYDEGGRKIVNFPTKGHWRAKSKLHDIENGLLDLRQRIVQCQIPSIAIPPLGCGNGGLEWADVRALIEKHLDTPELSGTEIYVYEPAGDFPSPVAKAPRLSLAHYVLASLRLGLQASSKLHLQKSAYWFNVYSGVDYFQFVHYKYGPYAPSLEPMIRSLVDYMDFCSISCAELVQDAKHRSLPGRDVDRLQSWSEHIDRAANLCNRHAGLVEVLATTHAVVCEEGPVDDESVVEKFFAWSAEKAKRFKPDDVHKALSLLVDELLIERELQGYVPTTRWRESTATRRQPALA